MSDERAVQEMIARYVRAVDYRDGESLAALFVADAEVEVFHLNSGDPVPSATLQGAAAIGAAVAGILGRHPPLGFSHHVTADPIVSVDGDEGRLDVQFIRFDTLGYQRPSQGWPAGATGSQGSVRPVEAGYYQSVLRRTQEGWRFVNHRILQDLPFAFPDAS
jgi:hypothetical protein